MPKTWAHWLRSRTRKGFRGYPVGTVAFYGPNDRRATKVVAGIVEGEEQGPRILRKWFSDELDVRADPRIGRELTEFLESWPVRSYAVSKAIIGCPHEEGIDYPQGEVCPECPYWSDKDRWANA
jgi:hypothetical protein